MWVTMNGQRAHERRIRNDSEQLTSAFGCIAAGVNISCFMQLLLRIVAFQHVLQTLTLRLRTPRLATEKQSSFQYLSKNNFPSYCRTAAFNPIFSILMPVTGDSPSRNTWPLTIRMRCAELSE